MIKKEYLRGRPFDESDALSMQNNIESEIGNIVVDLFGGGRITSSDGFKAIGSASNMNISISPGIAYTNKGHRMTFPTPGNKSITLNNSHNSNNRIDIIALRRVETKKDNMDSTNKYGLGNDFVYSRDIEYFCELVLYTGTPSSSPVKPIVPTDEIKICEILVKANSLNTGESGIITDTRAYFESKASSGGSSERPTDAKIGQMYYDTSLNKYIIWDGTKWKDIDSDALAAIANKVDKVAGKGLSTEDYTVAEKNKLSGIAPNANNYVHPANHPASIITQNATNRFVTDTQITAWDAKETPAGAKAKADAAEFNAKSYADSKIGDLNTGNVKNFGAKGDGSTNDTASIQQAIDYATDNGGLVYFPEGYYIITGTINVKKGVELRLERNTVISLNGNVRGFELREGSAISGGTIVIEVNNYAHEVIYLDGKYKYEDEMEKTFIKDINLWNWSGTTGGVGISLFSGGDTHHIQYLDMERVSIWNFDIGLKLKASDPGSGNAWINANKFDKFNIYECKTMIDIDSLAYVPYECSGNMFTNLQIQPGDNTEKVFSISGGGNTFTGMIWDLHMIEHDDEVIIFTENSDANHVDIRFFPENRVLNLGTQSNLVGSEGLLVRNDWVDSDRNWNTLTKMGTYRINISAGMNAQYNHPVGVSDYGILTVIESDYKGIIQIYTPYLGNKGLVVRSNYGTDWSPWVYHATSTDITSAISGLTKSNVGLGSVENYGLATQAEAQAGTAANKYMTPQRTRQAIESLAPTPTKEAIGLGNVDNVKQATKAEFDNHKTENRPHDYVGSGVRYYHRIDPVTNAFQLVVEIDD